MKNVTRAAIVGILFTVSAPALAMESYSDNRIRTLVYDANDIYTINTRYGYQTSIEFSAREEIDTISVGDRSMWQIIPSGYRLFIRPMAENVSTNMTIITNRRSYQFDLKSGGATPEKNPNLVYVAKFTYPDERPPVVMETSPIAPIPPVAVTPQPEMTPVPTQPPLLPLTPPADQAISQRAEAYPAIEQQAPTLTNPNRNYAYSYSGADAAAPAEVFDDGHSTYIRLKDMTRDLPRVYEIQANGKEVQLPFTRRSGYMVVDRVAARLVLVGTDTLFIYNDKVKP